jgi:2'-5' RNA ligase
VTADGAPARLFFGIFPDASACDALARVAKAAARETGGRAMRDIRIHLTLLFLGPVQPGRIGGIMQLAGGLCAPAVRVELARLAWWRSNRIVYAATDDTGPLTALAGALADALEPAGFGAGRERFLPHVTLVRDAARAPSAAMPPVALRADRFVLVRSVLGPGAARYERLAEFPLGA